ncbi:Proteasome stabiliser [Nakaseomyces glabratus]
MEKEKDLVEKVDLRFALADTAEKFQAVLDTFLAPLLLKLASPHEPVRQQVFESIKNILQRLGSLPTVRIPVLRLVEQAKKADGHNNVALYSLLFASKGVDRLNDSQEIQAMIPTVMGGISQLPEMCAARMFNLLCRLLLLWKPPMVSSLEEDQVSKLLALEDPRDLEFLMLKFTKFFMMVPNSNTNSGIIPRGYSSPGLSAAEIEFFTYKAGVAFNKDQLLRYKTAIFHFVTRGLIVFSMEEQLRDPENDPTNDDLKAVSLVTFLCVVSTDNSDLGELAITRLKRVHIPYENESFVNFMISLFTGDKSNGMPPTSSNIQETIFSILNRSIYATTSPENVKLICAISLNSTNHKLASLCLSFIRHVAKNNYDSLTLISSASSESDHYGINLPSMIRNNIQTNGWPRLQLGQGQQFNLSIKQRELQYETLGDLLKNDFDLIKDISYIEFLFTSLKNDIPQCTASIQHALNSVLHHLPQLHSDNRKKLKKLLHSILADDYYKIELKENGKLGTVEGKEREDALMSARYMAIKFTNSAFSFDDEEARMLNIFGTSTENRLDITEEAKKGLHPYWFRINYFKSFKTSANSVVESLDQQLGSQITKTKLPTLKTMSSLLLEEVHLLKEDRNSQRVIDKCLNNAVSFLRNCLVEEAIQGKNTIIVQDQDWLVRIEEAIVSDSNVMELVSEYISGIHEKYFVDLLRLLLDEFTERDHSGTQVSIAAAKNHIYQDLLLLLLKACHSDVLKYIYDKVDNLSYLAINITTYPNTEVITSSRALGIIGSSSEEVSNLLIEKFKLSNDLTASKLSHEHLKSILPNILILSHLLPRLSMRGYKDANMTAQLHATLDMLENFFSESITFERKLVLSATAEILKYGLLCILDASDTQSKIKKLLSVLGKKYLNDEDCTRVLSYLSLYTSSVPEMENIADLLWKTTNSKEIDYLFSVGECISIIAGGWHSKILLDDLDIYDPKLVTQLKQDFNDRYAEEVLKKVMTLCTSPNPTLKKAGTMWLLSLVQFTSSSPVIIEKCAEIHRCFVSALIHKDEIVQESAARGLALVYELGSTDVKEDMIKGLFKSFTSNVDGLKISSGSISESTELFDKDTLKTTDGSISTYKDILSLASEVGDPSIVYQFMSLAKNSMLWSSRKGIAFSLGSIMSKASLEKYLIQNKDLANKLIPKLYRYKFDPYTVVAQSMNDIWNTLIVDSKSTIDQYFDSILLELLEGMGNKEWRVREASTTALMDFVRSQPEEKFSGKILDIWTMAFRSMDDIKESVREAGTRFTTVLSKMLVRSIDTSNNVSPEHSEEILSNILPFLMGTKGINSDAEDVKNFSLKLLLDLVKNSPKPLSKFAPEIIYQFITLFSSLEPQVVNYLSLNAKNYNIDMKEIDNQRKNGIAVSPLFEALTKLIGTTNENQVSEVVDAVIRGIKKSIGLPSKVAAAQVVILIVKHYSLAIKQYSGKLLKRCVDMFEDKNEAVSIAYAQSFGYIYKVISAEKSLKYAKQLKVLFFSNSIDHIKIVVAAAILSLFRNAPSEFAELARVLTPVILLGKNDIDQATANVFSDLWTDTASSGAGTTKLYLDEIIDTIRDNIQSNDFSTRRSCAKTIAGISLSIDENTPRKTLSKIFDVTIQSLSGRSWDGKEDIVSALVSISEKCTTYLNGNKELATKIETTLCTEISRNNIRYVRSISKDYLRFVRIVPSDKLYCSFNKELLTKLFAENDENAATEIKTNPEVQLQSNKRMKTSITQHLSKDNIQAVDFMIQVLHEMAKDCIPYMENKYPLEFLNMILEYAQHLTLSHTMSKTWRVRESVCLIITELCKNFPLTIINQEIEDKFKSIWSSIFNENKTHETTENVKIETIRLGGEMIKKFSKLSDQIQRDLSIFTEEELSTARLAVELKNVGI